MTNTLFKYDKTIALIFVLLTCLVLLLLILNQNFFEWAFSRHQNQLSWYIRPVFILPFCYFSYKKYWSGISVTIFLLLTSMFWFPQPDFISDEVKQFLTYEKEWLGGNLTFSKVIMILLVPLSLTVLSLAFWKRSIWMGLAVIILIALGKIAWSILSAGESGKSILVPAITGLVICLALIYYGFRRMEKRVSKN